MELTFVKDIQTAMIMCVEKAKRTMEQGKGGPFGAAILKYDQEYDIFNVISCESNSVIGDNDPTAHAEVNAIRSACKKLNTFDLSDYTLVTTGKSCPMCVSATMWAGIKLVYYGTTYEDAQKLGFIDKHISEYIKGNSTSLLEVPIYRDIAIELHNIWDKKQDRVDY